MTRRAAISGRGAGPPGSAREGGASVVVVNYDSAELALACVDSLLSQVLHAPGGGAAAPEVIVVDSASSPEDIARLESLPAGVRLLRLEKNLGYAGAANAGLRLCRGAFLGLLNPDIIVHPGALETLVAQLAEHPEVAAVGPRTWMDEGRSVQHPLNRLPRLGAMLRRALGPRGARALRRESLAGTRFSLPYWEAEEPREIEMLSGACLVTRRDVLERVGGFDEGYPLYFEDADWCRRATRAGYRLLYVPGAEILHHYNRSAGKDPEAAERRRRASMRRYYRKVYGPIGGWLAGPLERTGRRRDARRAAALPWRVVDLGRPVDPPLLELPGDRRDGGRRGFLVELAGTPTFELAAAARTDGPQYRIPHDLWAGMPPGEMFVRVLDPESLRVRGVWRLRT